MLEPTDISGGLVAAAAAGDRRALGTVLAAICPFVVRALRLRDAGMRSGYVDASYGREPP